ncbi:MAG: O-antigen ligase family protein [Phenylobacterium sp.]|uniref:O-antigen ligase family protein n=1 Tax=Phenylobacterium sp. TaxID=1871053 RepID=UPI00272331AB|nr:O-antigen ligase family protein [Phenylobacterium sp.]MDO9430728.1 O-antigen ligase family protein [Phenylobacterium sp.]
MKAAKANAPKDGVAWFGWVLAGVFALSPLLGWLGPLGFAPIAALGGLLTIHGARVDREHRAAALAILVLVTWALASMAWSPFRAEKLENATGLKLVAQGVLYWALFYAGARASADTRAMALRVLVWGMAALGLVLAIEAMTRAGLYQALRTAIGDPIRPDLAVRNVAQGGFVLAVLTPAAAVASTRTGCGVWPIVLMAAGIAGASLSLAADAPILALVVSVLFGLAVYRWPVVAPRVLGGMAALLFLTAPGVVWLTRKLGWFQEVEASVSLSWSQRMGYWRHAGDWIGDHPLRGWGLEASREFAPGIILHPHNAALQIWLELGLIGAMSAAVFWGAVLAGLSRPERDVGRAAAAATAGAYLVFSAVSFGVWQEWWLALGAVAAAACMALLHQPAVEKRPA